MLPFEALDRIVLLCDKTDEQLIAESSYASSSQTVRIDLQLKP